ncbi:Metallo-dependent phosphatase-like protein [Cladochytrium replicatum]|nr:Metallo-dependent phosphatase-like protein [Cladochytrium replicatum]
MRLLFGSDLHGNLRHYAKLVSHAKLLNVDALLLGGDLGPRRGNLASKASHTYVAPSSSIYYPGAPPREAYAPVHIMPGEQSAAKGFHEAMEEHLKDDTERCLTPGLQQEFFLSQILPLLQTCAVPVYLIFGNSDFRANVPAYKYAVAQSPPEVQRVTILDGDVVYLARKNDNVENQQTEADGYWLFGTPWVPLSHHLNKDWELFDSNGDDIKQPDQRPKGSVWGAVTALPPHEAASPKSDGTTVSAHFFPALVSPSPTVQSQLEAFSSTHLDTNRVDPRRLVVMSHGPPHMTRADIIRAGKHVGSLALRRWTEKWSPLVILTGHVHETVKMSQKRWEKQKSSKSNGKESAPEFYDVISGAGGNTIVAPSGNDFKTDVVSFVVLDLEDHRVEKVERINLHV